MLGLDNAKSATRGSNPPASGSGTLGRVVGTPASSSMRMSGTRKRSPLLLVLSIVLILGSAALFGALYMKADDRVDVLVAAREIPAGRIVSQEDVRVISMSADGPAHITTADTAVVRGAMALDNIAAGTLLHRKQLTRQPFVPDGQLATGLQVSPAQLPREVRAGDRVRIWPAAAERAAGQGNREGGKDNEPQDTGPGAKPLVDRALVLSIDKSDSREWLVTIAANPEETQRVAPHAARRAVSMSLLAPEKK